MLQYLWSSSVAFPVALVVSRNEARDTLSPAGGHPVGVTLVGGQYKRGTISKGSWLQQPS